MSKSVSRKLQVTETLNPGNNDY